MRLTISKAILSLSLAAFLSAGAWATTTGVNSALPGTLNYVEGKVLMGSQSLDSKSVGSAELHPGQSLITEKGKAEVLLTPGIFLRVGDNSSVEMISPSLTDTEVGLDKGHAMIEVTEIHKENDIRINEHGITTQLLKTGLYDFDLNQEQLRVFDGKALVEEGTKEVTVKGGREVNLDGNGLLKAEKFKKKVYQEDDLYRWSSLRSAYLAEANIDAASIYLANGWGPWGLGWWGANWYWDPWFNAFTFIPANGIFYSPFGWGFYSPFWVNQAPFYGYGFGHHYHQFSANYHNWGPGLHYLASRNYTNGVYHGVGSSGDVFHSGARMASGSRAIGAFGSIGSRGGGAFHGGGGLHGGGGGFHGH